LQTLNTYDEEDFLQLSGIQHFSFCRRQWALIHIEQLWHENVRTIEGKIMHERAHDGDKSEKRGPLLIVRGMRVSSRVLGVSGICDVVEFHRSDDGVTLLGHEGKWLPFPVEYKRGKPKIVDADRLQLCCQAICLEEMLVCEIPEGDLFYGEPRRREHVIFTSVLRESVVSHLLEMHEYRKRGHTPKVRTGAYCKECSLNELCIPRLCKSRSAKQYMAKLLSKMSDHEKTP
jgi:CRISPR-associated exonuclease Cas4